MHIYARIREGCERGTISTAGKPVREKDAPEDVVLFRSAIPVCVLASDPLPCLFLRLDLDLNRVPRFLFGKNLQSRSFEVGLVQNAEDLENGSEGKRAGGCDTHCNTAPLRGKENEGRTHILGGEVIVDRGDPCFEGECKHALRFFAVTVLQHVHQLAIARPQFF
jgi:hypothetical protein